ncbi:MAG: tRNA dihydrouridine synthase [Akkermansiaceae bacterium]
MQDVTDLAFMRVMQQFGGPDYYVTEYFRVHSDYTLEKKILRSITENTTSRPVYAQLIGQDIDALRRVARELLEYPVEGIDLNLGCPAPVVCRKDAGGGLLRNLEKMENIIAALRDSIQGKFTVKTRVGYDSHEEFPHLLEIFQRHAIDTLTIHGRTVRERYQTPVHTDCIQLAAKTMACPVIANGNVVDAETGIGLLKKTNAGGLMIGRGAIRSPWIFDQLRDTLSSKSPKLVTRVDLLEYITLLYNEVAAHTHQFDETKHVHRMKKYLIYIVQGLDDAFEHQIRRVTSGDAFHRTCAEFLDNNDPVPQRPPERSKLFCGFNALRSTHEGVIPAPRE